MDKLNIHLNSEQLDKINSLLSTNPKAGSERQKRNREIWKLIGGMDYKTRERLKNASNETILGMLQTGSVPGKKGHGGRKPTGVPPKPKKKRTYHPTPKVHIFWGSYEDEFTQSEIYEQRRYFKSMGREYSIENIHKEIGQQKFGYISYWHVLVSETDYRKIPENYGLHVYSGNGRNYDDLLASIAFMMEAIYQAEEKTKFLLNLINAFRYVNPKIADRLQKEVYNKIPEKV